MKINITRRHLEIFITESATSSQLARKEFVLYGDIPVLVKDPLSEDVDLNYCLRTIEEKVPKHLTYGLDSVFIGQFPEFKEQQINAFYRDGAIYITNHQDDDEDFIDDVVHELAHLTEKTYGSVIYEDQNIMREFLGKRQRLFYMLRSEGYAVNQATFMETEYSKEFDMFLFEEIGYPLLTQLTVGLFLTPYAITSLPEYFAESFEYYFLQDSNYVRQITPAAFLKIKELKEIDE
jgi:hypothetical protein